MSPLVCPIEPIFFEETTLKLIYNSLKYYVLYLLSTPFRIPGIGNAVNGTSDNKINRFDILYNIIL